MGSTTTRDRPETRAIAADRVAFRFDDSVGIPIAIFRSSIPSPSMPLFMLHRTPRGARCKTRGRVARYAFLVRLFHPLLRAGLSRRSVNYFCRRIASRMNVTRFASVKCYRNCSYHNGHQIDAPLWITSMDFRPRKPAGSVLAIRGIPDGFRSQSRLRRLSAAGSAPNQWAVPDRRSRNRFFPRPLKAGPRCRFGKQQRVPSADSCRASLFCSVQDSSGSLGRGDGETALSVYELASHFATPRLYAALQCSQLAVWECPNVLQLQTLEQFLGRSFRFRLEPPADGGPDCGEAILACSPMSLWPCRLAMGWPNLSVLQLSQILEGVGAVELTGVDQAHEKITHLGAVECPVK